MTDSVGAWPSVLTCWTCSATVLSEAQPPETTEVASFGAVQQVTLVARDRRIRAPGDELKTGLRLMKPTKRGAWAYKRFEAHERAETARGVSEVQSTLR